MTGTPVRERFRGLFLALIMVTSVAGGTVAFSGGAAAATYGSNLTDRVILGSGDQSLGSPVKLTEDTNGEWGASGTGAITLPDGVTWNQSASDLSQRQVSSGTLTNVQFASNSKITFDYSGFDTGSNTSIEFSGLNVSVSTDVGSSFTYDFRVGVNTESKTVNTQSPTATLNATTVAAASSDSEIGDINITTPNLSGQIASGTNIVLTLNDSASGVTFNDALTSSDVDFAENASNINTSAVTFGEEQIVIPVTDSFTDNESLVIKNLTVNATADATDAQVEVTTRPENAVGDVVTKATNNVISVTKPTVSLSTSSYVADGRTNDSIEGNITITSNAAGDIGNGTNVTIKLNNSLATFDQSQGSIPLTNNTRGTIGPVVVNEDSLTFSVNVSGGLNGSENISIHAGAVELNVSDAASAGDEIAIVVETKSGDSAPTLTDTSSNVVTVTEPTVTFNEGSDFVLDVGDTGNTSATVTATTDLNFSEDANGQTDLANGANNVTISLESGTGVTFDQSSSLTVVTNDFSSNSTTFVDGKTLVVTLEGASDNNLDNFSVEGLALNATASATNTTVTFGVNTTDTSVDAGSIVVAESAPVTGDINNGSDRVIDLDDNDPDTGVAETGVSLGNASVTFPVEDDVPSSDFTVTLQLPDTGITFDQSASPTANSNNLGGASATATLVDGTTLNVTVTGVGTPQAGGNITIGQIALNATESASAATPTFSINGSSPVENRAVDHTITVNELTVDTLEADNDTTLFENELDGSTFTVDQSPSFLVKANNTSVTGNFSGADVALSLNNTATDASVTSSVETNESGYATFQFDPGTAAGVTYNITATTGSVTQNFTVTVTSGNAAQLDVVDTFNSVAHDGSIDDSVEYATLEVSVEDSGGNDVTSDTNVSVESIGLNVSGTVVGASATDDHNVSDATDFKGVSGTVNATSGTFYIYVAKSTGTVDATVSATTNLSSVTATTTIYSTPEGLDVTLVNSSQPLVTSETVNVSFEPLDENGDVIKVSGLDVTPSSSNSTVIQRASSSTTTNAQGVAYADFNAKNVGTATLQGVEQRSGILGQLTDVEVTEPTLDVALNVTEVSVDSTVSVNATVTYAKNGTAVQGATINVTGTGVSVADQTTNANGAANFSVTPSQTGTITVNATKGGLTTVSATIDVVEAGPVSISADPATENVTSTHSITATVRSESSGDSLNTIVVDYSVGANASDVSNVAQGDVTVSVAGQNVTDDLTGVSASNNGETLTLSFGGNYSLSLNDTVSITLENVQNPSTAGTYNVDITLNSQSDPTFTQTANLTIDEPQPFFEVSNLDAPANVTVGENVTVTATITNTGGAEGTQTVEFQFNNGTSATEDVTLAAGANTTVEFVLNTEGLSAGTYTHGVFTDDGSQTATLEIEAGAVFTSPLTGGEAAPKDPDDDGLYEDVNGDGEVNFEDALDLAFIQSEDLTQEQINALDFDNDGDFDFDDAFELAFQV